MAQRIVLELVIDETNEDSDFTTLQAAISKTISDYGFTLVTDILMPYDAKSDDERYGLEEDEEPCCAAAGGDDLCPSHSVEGTPP